MSNFKSDANGYSYWIDGTTFDPDTVLSPGVPFTYGPITSTPLPPISPGDKLDPFGPFTLGNTILGITFDEDSTNNSGSFSIPPDPMGAVGPNHIVSVVNRSIEWHLKDGTQQASQSLQNFFGSATATFDPKVIYDHHSDRFVVVTLERVNLGNGNTTDDESRMLIAVSDDADPNGTWTTHTIDTLINIGGDNFWADYPGIAVDDEAIYLTNNMFPTEAPSGFGQRLWIVDKGDGTGGFYDGGAASVTIHDPASATGGFAITMMPTLMFGNAPGTTGVWLTGYSGLSDGTDEFIQLIRVDDALGTPTFTQQFVNLGDITDTSIPMPNAPQLATTTEIETNDSRLLDAVWRGDSLYFATTIVGTGVDAGQATAYWGEIDTTTLAAPSFVQGGAIGGEDIATGAFTFFPSIAVNADGDVGVGFSASAPSIYGGSYFAWRDVADAAGTVQPVMTVQAGLDYYERDFGGARNRWGDYSGTVVDPADDDTFWTFNEYADVRGTPFGGEDGRWATVWGRFDEVAPDDFGETAASAGPLSVGGTATGEIEIANDIDWFAIDLVQDTTYVIQQFGNDNGAGGGTLPDTVIEGLYDPTETLIPGTFNDDNGTDLNSQITYTATTTGTHYLAAGAFSINTGTYTVSADIVPPDLVAQNVSLTSTTWMDGVNETVGFDFANIGAGATAAGAEFAVFLSTDNVITTGDTFLSFGATSAALLPGASELLQVNAVNPSFISPGTYYIGVIVDDLELIPESDETNNVGGPLQITVVPNPDFAVSLFDGVGGLQLGRYATIQAALDNANYGDFIQVGAGYAANPETVSTSLADVTLETGAGLTTIVNLVDTNVQTFSQIGAGTTIVNGNSAASNFYGGPGNDTFSDQNGGASFFDGNGGSDTLNVNLSLAEVDVLSINSGFIDIYEILGSTENVALEIETVNFTDVSFNVVDTPNGSGTYVGTSVNDIIVGSSTADYLLDLGGGNDILLGGAGNDQLQGSQGADRNVGGSGTDEVRYNNSNAAVTVNLATGTATGGHADGDTFNSIENLVGSGLGDSLTGDGGVNRLDGFNGDDTLQGGLGPDILFGGQGEDTADYSDSLVGVDVGHFRIGTGGTSDGDQLIQVERIIGSDLADTLVGSGVYALAVLSGGGGDDLLFDYGGASQLNGGAGNDTMIGRLGADAYDGGDDIDVVRYTSAVGAVNANLTTGVGSGADAEGDTFIRVENLVGSIFFDTLVGDGAVNRIEGGAGRDTINGKGGNDQLYGGADLDTFVFDALNWGDDLIFDFDPNPGREKLDFTGLGLSFNDFVITDTAFGLRIDYADVSALDGFSSIALAGVDPSQITSDDFIFGP